MKNLLTPILITILSLPSLAVEKSEVTITERGHSVMDGDDRAIEIEIKLSNGHNNGPMSNEDKIHALERQVAFYRLMDAAKVDLEKNVTAKYTGKRLKDVLAELVPDVQVKFNGIEQDVTIGTMEVTKASLKKVLGYLDNAAGVYFSFSADGILVAAEPQ